MKRYNRKYACKESFIYYRIINSYYSHRKLKEQDIKGNDSYYIPKNGIVLLKK